MFPFEKAVSILSNARTKEQGEVAIRRVWLMAEHYNIDKYGVCLTVMSTAIRCGLTGSRVEELQYTAVIL